MGFFAPGLVEHPITHADDPTGPSGADATDNAPHETRQIQASRRVPDEPGWEDNVATDEVIEQRVGEDPEDEDVKERLEREHTELLEELRALIPGAQVLFGFLLAIRFTSPFSDLNAVQRSVYYATLLSTAVALVLLLAPGPRQSRDSSPFVR